jgi:hypothetical protein
MLVDMFNCRIKKKWCPQNPKIIHRVLMHDEKVGVWCVMRAAIIIGGHSFFS